MGADTREVELLSVLGAGGFGTVYLANLHGRDRFLRRVAVKLLRDGAGAIVDRQRDEARLLGLLAHEGIVQVIDLATLCGQPAILMEYVHGVDLARLLDDPAREGQPLPARAALEIARGIASALEAAWSGISPASGAPLRVVHRDIKPGNALLTPGGAVKLLDFGIARADFLRDSRTGSGLWGTPRFIAPELWEGAEPGPAGDTFALGVTLLDLLGASDRYRDGGRGSGSGSPARRERDPAEIRRRTPDLPPEAQDLLVATLARDPAERPGHALLRDRLTALLDRAPGPSLATFAARAVPPLLTTPRPAGPPDPLIGRRLPLSGDPSDDPSGAPPGDLPGSAPLSSVPPGAPRPALSAPRARPADPTVQPTPARPADPTVQPAPARSADPTVQPAPARPAEPTVQAPPAPVAASAPRAPRPADPTAPSAASPARSVGPADPAALPVDPAALPADPAVSSVEPALRPALIGLAAAAFLSLCLLVTLGAAWWHGGYDGEIQGELIQSEKVQVGEGYIYPVQHETMQDGSADAGGSSERSPATAEVTGAGSEPPAPGQPGSGQPGSGQPEARAPAGPAVSYGATRSAGQAGASGAPSVPSGSSGPSGPSGPSTPGSPAPRVEIAPLREPVAVSVGGLVGWSARLDGRAIGALPQRVVLAPGTYALRVEPPDLPDYARFSAVSCPVAVGDAPARVLVTEAGCSVR